MSNTVFAAAVMPLLHAADPAFTVNRMNAIRRVVALTQIAPNSPKLPLASREVGID